MSPSVNTSSIISPITGLPSRIVEKLDVQRIKEVYYEELNVDVSDYFKGTDNLLLCECNQTNYRFYYPSIVGEPSFYKMLDGFEWYYPKWKWENELSLKYIKRDSVIIDIGCGSGNFLFNLNNKGYSNLSGIDTGNVDEAKFKENGVTFSNQNIEEFVLHNSSTYDVVTCFQILEHITDINSFINSCLKLLKNGGKLIIGVPNNNPYLYKYDVYHSLNLPPHHQGLWSKISLENICGVYPMKKVSIEIEPVGQYIGSYSNVQVNYFSKKSKLLKHVLQIKLFFKIYTKILYVFKNVLEGRNIVAVYEKNGNN